MRYLPLLFVVCLWPTAAVGAGEGPDSIRFALETDLQHHPEIEAADVYKFVHQAIYGPGHAIPNREAAARYLAHEIATLGPPGEGELACEVLGGEPVLVRVNLRPFIAATREDGALLDAFVTAANQVHGDSDRMRVAIAAAEEVLLARDRGEIAAELRELAVALAATGYPAVHHSDRYREAYAPAYRVVTHAAATENGWCE